MTERDSKLTLAATNGQPPPSPGSDRLDQVQAIHGLEIGIAIDALHALTTTMAGEDLRTPAKDVYPILFCIKEHAQQARDRMTDLLEQAKDEAEAAGGAA